ncbi:MAG: DUF4234 domain-containing protein [Clostridia bacterium]|nr:DUF4234 domain-containing protein [Clostridia bacterium]
MKKVNHMTEETNNTYKIKRRPLIVNLILSLITLNIYTFIWLYAVLKDSNRIAAKKRNSMPIYRVLLLSYVALVTCCFVCNTILIFAATCYDTNVGYPLIEISSPVIENVVQMALTALMLVLLIQILFSAICMAVCSIILMTVCSIIITVNIAKNLDVPVGYYVVFQLFLGIAVINLFAQDVINPYAGTYLDGERPKYLG